MNRLDQCFDRLQEQGRKALIPYLTAGDPHIDDTYHLAQVLEQAGADILELGVPFSDPLADGPTIQSAAERALQAGTTPNAVLEVVSRIRQVSQIPIVLLVYYNTVLRLGEGTFMKACANTGVDGLVIPDLPTGVSESLSHYSLSTGVKVIHMLAPTSTLRRIREVCQTASGFIYCVSTTGVTGMRSNVSESLASFLETIRACTSCPLAVGFGISNPEQAVQVASVADGIIVGSALVELVHTTLSNSGKDSAWARAHAFISSFRENLDAGLICEEKNI